MLQLQPSCNLLNQLMWGRFPCSPPAPRISLLLVSCSQELGWSEVESCVSPPATGRGASATLLAVADLGQASRAGALRLPTAFAGGGGQRKLGALQAICLEDSNSGGVFAATRP